jgi:hypothetical protein
MTLADALDSFLSGEAVYCETGTGLRLQFRQADAENPYSRLLCYRASYLPTLREFLTIRQQLEKALPGAQITLSPPAKYIGKDGRSREGRVFSWIAAQPVQGKLI